MAGNEGDEVDAPVGALSMARAHLATVSLEISRLQEALRRAPGQSVFGEQEEAQSLDLTVVAPAFRHLEVDRDESIDRAARLEEERDELLAVQGRLEAEISTAHRENEELRRKLQHSEVDARLAHQMAGGGGVGQRPEFSNESAFAPERDHGLTEASKHTGAFLVSVPIGRPTGSMSKLQLLASLRMMQGELQEESKRTERLQKRMRKDRERMKSLVDLAERQQDELTMLRATAQVPSPSAGSTSFPSAMLSEDEEANESTLERRRQTAPPGGLSSITEESPRKPAAPAVVSPPGPSGPRRNPPGMTPQQQQQQQKIKRQQSLPSRLPSVGNKAAASY